MAKQSPKYELVKGYYTRIVRGKRLWDAERVMQAAEHGWITKAEASRIIEEDDNAAQ